MRENEAGRPRVPWRSHPWFKRISSAAAHVSAAALLTTGAADSLAARKNKNRNEDRADGKDEAAKARDRDGGGNRDRDGKQEKSDRADEDGGRNRDRDRTREREADESTDAEAGTRNKQQSSQQQVDEPPNPDDTGGGGGGGGRDGGGDGGGNNTGNAGSGFFDSPLATKARRRANDFDNPDREDEEDGIFVDVDPEGESVYETGSISYTTGPDGVEILTKNITYFAEPTPTPTPFPELELPVREPGFPFGEDFPFGDATVAVTPTAPEPSDPGDTPVRPADPASVEPAPDEPAPADSDGGDNTMDFTS